VLTTLPFVARILIWALVLVCTGIFVWRRIQHIPIRGPAGDRDRAAPTEPEEVADPFGAHDPSRPGSPPGGSGLPSGPADELRAGPGQATPGSVEPGAPEPSASRGGFFAAGPAQPAGAVQEPTSPASGRPTVAEAVEGIAMPCGLAPVIDGSSVPNPFRVSFLTTLAPAPEVGRAVADELERLGFALSTATPTELVARRGPTQLRVVLFPSASSAKRGLLPMFPAAPPGAVGIELST